MYFSLPWEIIETDARPISDWSHIEPDAPLYSTRQTWANGRDLRLSVEEVENTVVWGIWGDTAPFLTRDSLYLLTYSAVSGNTHKRHRFCGWAKRMTCDCGCRGRHTFEVVWAVLAWAFQVMLSGFHPTVRHDGVPFAESGFKGDRDRARRQGPLRARGCCLQKRGDWAWLKQCLFLTGCGC